MAVPAFVELSGSRRLGAYDVLRLLGRGGMGSVYECRHTVLGRAAAIKVLHPHLAQNRVTAARFLREGQIAARVRHPNVVEVLDFGEHGGVPYLVMEFVDGEDLTTHFRQRSPMSIPGVIDCISGVIAGVVAAHEAGIVHRDLKPSNIRLAADHLGELEPKVLDFGISKVVAEGVTSDLTDTNGALGTTRYMAPEQLRSAKHADARSDIYAVGVILYEGLTGRLPFDGSSVYDHLHAVLTGSIKPPRTLRPDMPPALEAVVLRALQRAPEARFASARELGQALARFATDSARWGREFANRSDGATRAAPSAVDTGASVTIPSAAGRLGRGRGPRVFMAIAVAALAVAIATAGWRTRPRAASEHAAVPAEVQPGPAAGAETAPKTPPTDPGTVSVEPTRERLPDRASRPPATADDRSRVPPSPVRQARTPAVEPRTFPAPDLYDHM